MYTELGIHIFVKGLYVCITKILISLVDMFQWFRPSSSTCTGNKLGNNSFFVKMHQKYYDISATTINFISKLNFIQFFIFIAVTNICYTASGPDDVTTKTRHSTTCKGALRIKLQNICVCMYLQRFVYLLLNTLQKLLSLIIHQSVMMRAINKTYVNYKNIFLLEKNAKLN